MGFDQSITIGRFLGILYVSGVCVAVLAGEGQDNALLLSVLGNGETRLLVGKSGELESVETGEVTRLGGHDRDVLLLLDETVVIPDQLPDEISGQSHVEKFCLLPIYL